MIDTLATWWVTWRLRVALVGVSVIGLAAIVGALYLSGKHAGMRNAEIECATSKADAIAELMNQFTIDQAKAIESATKDKAALQARIDALASRTPKTRTIYMESVNENPLPANCIIPSERMRAINEGRSKSSSD